ncbi:MAG: phosphoribosylformylglycinamidine cyclo-ligase [Coriobacteriales bacterium]|jgi:phosphoribosylformylglycinamidine cyclo-ligase
MPDVNGKAEIENGEGGKQITYEDAGVNTAEGARAVDRIKDAVASTNRPEVIGGLGGFGGLFSAAAFKDMEDPILVSGTDGVGTKLKLAQRLGINNTVGIDLVAMCANDVVVCGAEPLFFLDYIAIEHLEADFVGSIVEGVAEGCRQAGCALIGGEMAEHPGVMAIGDYDLSGFCVGVVDRPKMIGPDLVQEGDSIVGLASSGIHSNGYSLVRKVLLDQIDDEKLKAPDDFLAGKSIGEALLEPTKIYVKPILSALKYRVPIHACAHITGGGITENLDRALPRGLDAQVRVGSWPEPRIVRMVAKAARLSLREQLKTLNSGIGMCIICPPDSLADVMEHFAMEGEEPYVIGSVVKGPDPDAKGKVTYIDVETGEAL